MEAETPVGPERDKMPHSILFYLVFAAGLYALIQLHALLAPIVLSFVLIILITLAVNPIISRLRTWTGGRKRAAGLMGVGILVIGGLSVWAAAGPVSRAAANLSERVPGYWERLQKPLIKLEQQGVISEKKMQKEVSEEIAQEEKDSPEGDEEAEEAEVEPVLDRTEPNPSEEVATEQRKGEDSLRSSLGKVMNGLLGQMKGWAHNTTEILIVLVTVFVGVTFTLLNPQPIFGAMFSMVPERHHARTLEIVVRIAKFVPCWAGAMLASMVAIGSLFFVLMWPIFGFSDALILGLIACLLSVIPFLGPFLTLIPALLLAIGEGGMTPVWVLLAFITVQVLEEAVILPLVMSRGMALHPMAVIFSMLLSVAAFGVLGVLVAAPLVGIFGILHEELYRKRFLATTTDEDLDGLARGALIERPPKRR